MPAAALAGLPEPRQTEGIELRPAIIRLLEEYVAIHQDELAQDMARYGDPRQAPGFDRQRAAEERTRASNRLLTLRAQTGEAPLLYQKLDKLKQQIEKHAADSLPVQRERQRVMDEYRRYAKYEPDELSAEVKGWSPPFALGFHVASDKEEPDPVQIDRAYELLLDSWEHFRQRFPELDPQLRQYVLDFFRQFRACDLLEDERTEYEDDDGQLSDEKILAHIKGATVALTCHTHGEVEVVVQFDVPWDEEHGLEVQFGPDGEIEQWF